MKPILSERNIVVLLFVMVMITFSLAHEDTKKMEQIYLGASTSATKSDFLVNMDPATISAPAGINSITQ
jgi:hypothetical protein